MRDVFTDLVLGGRCVACQRPGRALCRACADALPQQAFPAWPSPTPAGLVPPWAGAAYDGAVRAMVVAHKERAVLGLQGPLGRLLALSARAAAGGGRVVLVPVPSRPGVVRARGHDPGHTLARTAARVLRSGGHDVSALRLLQHRGGVVDQAGLDAEQRAVNLAGSMACPTASVRRVAGQRLRVVVCDDVLTTGSTAREAQRALEAAGLAVAGIAVVAATRRRQGSGGASAGFGRATGLPLCPATD